MEHPGTFEFALKTSDELQRGVSQCLNRVQLRAKSKRKLGVKLSAVEAHILRSGRLVRRRAFGPPVAAAAWQVLRVFARPLPIMLVIGIIVASEASSNASRSIEELPQPIAEPIEENATAVLDEKILSAQQQLAKEEEAASVAAADHLLRKAAITVEQIPQVDPLQSAEPQSSAEPRIEPNAGLIEFISGVIAVYYPEISDPGIIARRIVEASRQEDIDPLFIASVIAVESRFKVNARSNKGAFGLMQLKLSTAREVSRQNGGTGLLKLSDPAENIRLGIHYIKQLERRYKGNRSLALAAYNWGPANVDDALQSRSRIPGSVRSYAYTILEKALRWNRHFQAAIQHARTYSVTVQENS